MSTKWTQFMQINGKKEERFFVAWASVLVHGGFVARLSRALSIYCHSNFSGARSVRGRFFMFSAAKGAYYRNPKREATDFEKVFLVVSSNVMKFERY